MGNGVLNSYFNSICLTIMATIFMTLIIVTYVRKEKIKSITTSLYLITIVFNVLTIIMEFFLPFIIKNILVSSNPPIIYLILCKSYMFFAIVWDLFYFLYAMITVSNIRFFYDEEKKKFNKKFIYVILLIFIFALSIVLIFNMEFTGGTNNLPYTIVGTIRYVFDIVTVLASFYVLFIYAYFSKKIRNINVLSYNVIFLCFVFIVIIEFYYDFYFNYMAFMGSLIMINTYFTMENQDNILLSYYNKTKEDTQKASEAKSNFLSSLSHEIRSPMNTISVFGESLVEKAKTNVEEYNSDLNSILNESTKLLDLVNNISDISKIEMNDNKTYEKDYDFSHILNEILQSNKEIAIEKHLQFNINVNQNIPRYFHGDEYKVMKIINNILLNAIDFTSYGGINIIINGNLIENNYYEFLIDIKCSGHAMSYITFDKEFDDFINVDKNSNLNKDIKLGVIIAKHYVKLLDGDIIFKNEKGNGTEYIIKYKQLVRDNTPMNLSVFESGENQKISFNGKKALIIDDVNVNLILISRYLQKYGFNVFTVNNESNCEELINNNKYDIVFLKKDSPNINYDEVIRLFNATGTMIPPIIALTNSNEDEMQQDNDNSYYDYLTVPINTRKIFRIINMIFNNEKRGDGK